MTTMPSRRRAKATAAAAGFSLLEVAVVISLMTVVLGSVFSVIFGFERLFSSTLREQTVDEAGWSVCERISAELRSVDPRTLLPLTISSSTYLTYQKVNGYSGGSPTLGPVTTLSVELAPGETDNNADDNGDGRADEGFLTLAEGGSPSLRARGNVLNLSFDSTANGIAFSVEVGISDRSGNVRKKTFNREVSFRVAP